MSEDYEIRPARYAHGQMLVTCRSDGTGWKTRAMALCGALNGRWTNRERGYIMSPTKAAKFEKMYAAGWSGNVVSGDLIAPEDR